MNLLSFFKKGSLFKQLFIIVPIVVFFDQLTKWVALSHIHVGQSLPVFSFFNFVLVFNKGVSFGLFQSNGMLGRWILIGLALALCVWLLKACTQTKNKYERNCYILIIGGAISNLMDRFFYGGVVDFLDFHWHQHHWPAFNIADSVIVCSVMGVFFHQFFSASPKKKKK